jgi:hypothetical protein
MRIYIVYKYYIKIHVYFILFWLLFIKKTLWSELLLRVLFLLYSPDVGGLYLIIRHFKAFDTFSGYWLNGGGVASRKKHQK